AGRVRAGAGDGEPPQVGRGGAGGREVGRGGGVRAGVPGRVPGAHLRHLAAHRGRAAGVPDGGGAGGGGLPVRGVPVVRGGPAVVVGGRAAVGHGAHHLLLHGVRAADGPAVP